LTIKFVTYSAHMGNKRMRFILRASKNILWWVKAKKKLLPTYWDALNGSKSLICKCVLVSMVAERAQRSATEANTCK